MTYTVVVLRETDGRFSVVAPALPGCATWGRTTPQALRMAEEAILAHLDGLRALGQEPPPDEPSVTVELADAVEANVYRMDVRESDGVSVV